MRFFARRRLCRVTFAVFCLLPTVIVACTVLVTHSPPYRAFQSAMWQSRLSARLGFDVGITRLEQRPDGALLYGIELRDPESHEWLARARSAEVAFADQGIIVSVSHPEIRFERLTRIAQILHEQVLMRSDQDEVEWQLTASSLALRRDEQAQSLHNLQCIVESQKEGTELLLAFCVAGVEADQCVRLRVVRNRQIDPAATGWELHTGPAGLPCWLGNVWFTGLGKLGDDCTFCGSIWAEQGAAGWNADVAGAFRNVDLDQLVTSQFPHKLSGVAELSLNGVKIQQGRVVKVAGLLQCDGGVVSRSLLDAAEWAFHLRQHEREGDADKLRYGRLSFGFSMDGQNLTIAGADKSTPTVMADSHGPLLSISSREPLSPVNVLRMLVPQNEVHVPATTETVALLRVFPLPRVMRQTPRHARRSYGPLRFVQ